MKRPEISVIVPVFNVEQYLSRCIESILLQSFYDFELLLIDDGSFDNSGKICDEYAEKDDRIRVFHKENGGVSSARNVGLCNAQGNWVCFVDGDDSIEKAYLSILFVENLKESSLVIMNYLDDLNVKDIQLSGKEMVKYFIESKLIRGSGPYCKLFNNRILKYNTIIFNTHVHMGEDGLFLLQYLYCIDNMIVLENRKVYNYIQHPGSLSTKYYTFESEYECFQLWHRYLCQFVEKYGEVFENVEVVAWKSRVDEAFLRSVQALSRHRPRYKFMRVLHLLEAIPKEHTDNFGFYYETNLLRRKLSRFLIKKRWFVMYWLYSKLDFLYNMKYGKI